MKASPTTSRNTKGSIGYVEYAYAKQNKLTTRQHDQQGRQDGRAERCSPSKPPPPMPNGKAAGFYVILTDQPGAGSWPIAGATFILIHKQPQDPAAAAEALKFFDWAYAKGDKMAEELDYVPMPDNVVTLSRRCGRPRSRTRSGKPLCAASH